MKTLIDSERVVDYLGGELLIGEGHVVTKKTITKFSH